MAYAPGVALLAVLVAGCSAGSDGTADDPDSKPGSPTVSAAPPGRYRTLPEPCRAVPLSTLKDLLPGAAELPVDQQEKVYEGTAAVTYDTDRKVGCRWKADSPDMSRNLVIDFERVVSYDPAVSDDYRAGEVYTKKETAADLPVASTPDGQKETSPGATPTTPSAGNGTGAGGPTGASGATADALQPRILDNLGDAAFLDDVLTRAGSTAQHRTVSVVFRTSNVIVTVRYSEQPALVTKVPDSKELQEKARALARKLADTLSE
ncbi:DUF3558 domain-containing protein [Streptomyces finlayi]|uniref:DUF3558 domain-containing protein n=1 Tax=Streptomyces finlayi TaxID=67296 RepID=A0A7G7BN02_9ACTN|nr:DUF3558 domain-containing protein [Streptomyces finlayi]QNE76717.1 DUF3558 domain-containing protein [Streptomyces finlayi]